MTMTGGSGAMEMKYLDAMDLPAGKAISLDPAGWHVWLSGLNRPLRTGQAFPLSLRFEKAGEQTITVSVIAPAAPAPMAGMKM
jgi:copper(I)-binding protein